MKEFIVEKHHLASQVGSGGKDVLSSPFLLAFMEKTCYDKMIEYGENVGVKVNMTHLRTSNEGSTVCCKINNIEKTEKKWIFDVSATTLETVIGICIHTRYFV